MIKLIKSMLYRATHDFFFYIAAGLCLLSSLFFFLYSSDQIRNHMPSRKDKNVIVRYEEEDPLIVSKHLVFDPNTNYHNVPGHDVKYLDSISNVYSSSAIVLSLSIVVFAFHVLYGMYFFGELFTKGGIRNMIAAGSTKLKIFISSLIVNAILLLVFSAVCAVMMLIISLIRDLYMIIYLPAFCLFLLTDYLIGIVFSSLAIVVVFITQRPLRALLIVIGCSILCFVSFAAVEQFVAFEPVYIPDQTSWKMFTKQTKDNEIDFEWYFPVNDFNLYMVKKADGTIYSDFMSDKPNPDYSGDTKVAIMRIVFRLNISNFILESLSFYVYPMYRDGVLLRYIVVSSVYLCLVTAAGCIVVKRRDII